MTGKLSFRPVAEKDYPTICHLVESEEELFRIYPRGTYPLTPEQIGKLARERLALTVAELDGSIIGFANLYDHEPHASAFIGNAVIDKCQRGKGYGRALINHMVCIAFDELDLPEARISVFADNTPALLLYHALGFRPCDMEERQTRQGKRTALIHMALNQAV